MLSRLSTVAIILSCAFLRAQSTGPTQYATEQEITDFQSEDTYFDASDALRSKQYVRRAILSNVIDLTSNVEANRFYINHLMGFSAILQRNRNFTKYLSGMQGLSLGYVTDGSHGLEIGAEFSAVSNLFAGYRYFVRPKDFSLWPFIGGGFGTELTSLSLSDGPAAADLYDGPKSMFFGTLGVLIPLVEVALKAELRFNFYGSDRWILTQGVGIVIFL